jgi:hypothetical protein
MLLDELHRISTVGIEIIPIAHRQLAQSRLDQGDYVFV